MRYAGFHQDETARFHNAPCQKNGQSSRSSFLFASPRWVNRICDASYTRSQIPCLCDFSPAILVAEISARKCGKPRRPRELAGQQHIPSGTALGQGMGYRPVTLSLSLPYPHHTQKLRRTTTERNQITLGWAGVAGDERKEHLSVFPSVSVACNPSFINSFINCDFEGRG